MCCNGSDPSDDPCTTETSITAGPSTVVPGYPAAVTTTSATITSAQRSSRFATGHHREIATRATEVSGQLGGVHAMYENGRYCLAVLDQLSAVRATTDAQPDAEAGSSLVSLGSSASQCPCPSWSSCTADSAPGSPLRSRWWSPSSCSRPRPSSSDRRHHAHSFSRTGHGTRDRGDDRPRGTPPGQPEDPGCRGHGNHAVVAAGGTVGSTHCRDGPRPPEFGVTGALGVDRRHGPPRRLRRRRHTPPAGGRPVPPAALHRIFIRAMATASCAVLKLRDRHRLGAGADEGVTLR